MKKIVVLLIIFTMSNIGFAEEVDFETIEYGWNFDETGGLFELESDKTSYGHIGVTFSQAHEVVVGQPIVIRISSSRSEDINFKITTEKGLLEPLYPIYEVTDKGVASATFDEVLEYTDIISLSSDRPISNELIKMKWSKNDLVENETINYHKPKGVAQTDTYFSFIPTEQGDTSIVVVIELEGKIVIDEIHSIKVEKEKATGKFELKTSGNKIKAFAMGLTQGGRENEISDIGFHKILEHSSNIKVDNYKKGFEEYSNQLPPNQVYFGEKEGNQKETVGVIEAEMTDKITSDLEAEFVLRRAVNMSIANISTLGIYAEFEPYLDYVAIKKGTSTPTDTPTGNTKRSPIVPLVLLSIVAMPLIVLSQRLRISLIENSDRKSVYVNRRGGGNKDINVIVKTNIEGVTFPLTVKPKEKVEIITDNDFEILELIIVDKNIVNHSSKTKIER